MITTTLKVAEMSKITYEEFPNYTKEALVADIGGALENGLHIRVRNPSGSRVRNPSDLRLSIRMPDGSIFEGRMDRWMAIRMAIRAHFSKISKFSNFFKFFNNFFKFLSEKLAISVG